MTFNKEVNMTKEKAIKKLTKFTDNNYSIQVEATTAGPGQQGAKVFIQIIKPKDDGVPQVLRVTSAYGIGQNLEEAQEKAIIAAISNLGL